MQATMEAALDAIAADPRNGDPSPLVELVNALRPGAGRHHREAIANLHALTSLLTHRPTYGSALRAYLLYLIATRRPVHFYANTGIQSQEGFGRALMQKLAFRILPPALDRDSLEDILTLVFWKGDDWRWLRAIPPESWDQLFATLAHGEPGNEEDMKKVGLSILEAAQVISYASQPSASCATSQRWRNTSPRSWDNRSRPAATSSTTGNGWSIRTTRSRTTATSKC
jgi:site-specific recombinase